MNDFNKKMASLIHQRKEMEALNTSLEALGTRLDAILDRSNKRLEYLALPIWKKLLIDIGLREL